MEHGLTQLVSTQRVMNGVTAGTTSTTSTAVDTLGYAAVRFLALFGTLTASQVTNIKVQHSDDNSTFADVSTSASSNMADADSNKALIVELFKPQKRYVRLSVQRGTANAVIDGVVAELYRPSFGAVTAHSTISSQEIINSAGSGTA